MRRLLKNKKFIAAAIILAIVAILMVWPSNYYLLSPGMAKTLAPMIDIEGTTYLAQGKIMLTAVSMKQASILEYLYVKIVKPELVKLESKDFLPPGVGIKEYFELMQEMMKESQLKAKAVGLKEAGYNPKITGQGVKIVKVLKEGDAAGKLKKGDIIVAVDGQPVELLTETVNKIQSRPLGTIVNITVDRGQKEKSYKIKTRALQENSNKPSIGVLITPYKREYDFPINISINAKKIGGPSAGSMFALEIYNQLTKHDITNGLKIAGTGTVSLDGSIGKIDGVKQKVVAARKEGAKIFFTPMENAKEAKKIESEEIKVVAVKNISEIINYLKNLK